MPPESSTIARPPTPVGRPPAPGSAGPDVYKRQTCALVGFVLGWRGVKTVQQSSYGRMEVSIVPIFLAMVTISSLSMPKMCIRDSDTAAGIDVALVVNAVIVPYNNKAHIRSLLTQLRAQIPQQVESIVIFERFPDLQPNVCLLYTSREEL